MMAGFLSDAVRLALALAALLLPAAWLVHVGLRLRGPIWHVEPPARRRRILLAVPLAAVLGLLATVVALRIAPDWLHGRFILGPAALLGVALALRPVWRLYRLVRAGEFLLGGDANRPESPLPATAPPAIGRRIVICCDGTGNRPPAADSPAASNVWKLHRALRQDATQSVWYDPGVATGSSGPARGLAALAETARRIGFTPFASILGVFGTLRTIWESATGTGIGENITEAYREIIRQYRPGDRIYLFGFSRGAYTARCVAGVIARCGVLQRGHINEAQAMVSLYRARRELTAGIVARPGAAHWPVPVEMLGVFDTVASLGAPLWGWWFNFGAFRNGALNTNPAPACRYVYHALAMDERRASFFPTLFDPPGEAKVNWTEPDGLEQTWFRGAHGDIGGGYAETGLSDIALEWMLQRAARHGLTLAPTAFDALRPDPLAPLHDEMGKPAWQQLGSWPRWHPVLAGRSERRRIGLHDSVLHRAQALQAGYGLTEMRRLEVGEHCDIQIDARQPWNRTGLVIEDDTAIYRLRWLGGEWFDAGGTACGPAGQDDARDRRRFLRWTRRLAASPWMCLCGTIAAPRNWPLRELGPRDLLRYLILTDPPELLEEVAPLGESMAKPGHAVLLSSARPPGLLHLFANDAWRHYGNNAGGLTLRVERLPAAPAGVPHWHRPLEGPWQRRA